VSFPMFNFHPRIMAGVQSLGYLTPTPIQQQAIPPVLQGRDVMGLAQTGTGKTAAFALPILQRLIQRTHRHVRALIIAPTRELAEQIHVEISALGRQTTVRSMSLYGGVGMLPRSNNCAVASTLWSPALAASSITYARAPSICRRWKSSCSTRRSPVRHGLYPDIRQIVSYVPAQRQTLLFAATMPDDVRRLAHDILSDPITIQVGPMGQRRRSRTSCIPSSRSTKLPGCWHYYATLIWRQSSSYAHEAARQACSTAIGQRRLWRYGAAGQFVAASASGRHRWLPSRGISDPGSYRHRGTRHRCGTHFARH